MKKVQSNSMFNSDLTPMFDGCVMMNESAMNNPIIMAVLAEEAKTNFEYKSRPSGYWNISDRD